MRKFFSAVLIFCFTATAMAQLPQGRLITTVLTTENTPLDGATVELLRSADSLLVKTALSGRDGRVEMEGPAPAAYRLRVTAAGHLSFISPVFTLKENETFTLPSPHLQKAENRLQDVTVSARKPFLQRLNDRLVVNVENSVVNAGSSGLDVLERSPGITLDANDNIILRGKQGVIIMIDGKPSPMSGADLANYLRGLPVQAIERIEIITNPPSKYEAAGNAGIIDIRLKKDQRQGYNGSLTAGYSQGVYPKWNSGATFNYRKKSVNVFGNYNYSYRELLNHLIINRNFFEQGVFKGSDDKDNYMFMPLRSHTARLGADFFTAKNTTFGVVVNGNFNRFNRQSNIQTQVKNAAYQPEFRFHSLSTNNDFFNNSFVNLNFRHKLDTAGGELTADVDYGVFRSGSLTRTASAFFNLDETKRKEDDILDGDQNGKLILKTAKIDYTRPLQNGVKLEAGLKSSYVSSDNDAKFYNVLPGGSIVDEAKTNQFLYGEYNNAAYASISREYKRFTAQVGLRGELTNLRTRQVKGNTRFHKDYFQLFPSSFFTYKLNAEQTLGISVSRRIDRPGYSDLNPFLFQVDATIYSTGQPLLKPQTTWSYEGSYTMKSLQFTLAYSHTKDPQNTVLSKILDVLPNFEIKPGQDSNITVQIPVNLQSSDYVGLTVSAPVRIRSWWNMVNNANLFYNKFKGRLSGAQLNNGSPAANLRTNNSFTFSKGWVAELNASFNSGGRRGYTTLQPQWSLGAGVQKTLLQGKGTLRLNATDIFWTSRPKAKELYEGSYLENWQAYRDSRAVNLSFTYRFGNSKVQQARKRTTASEEERQRAGAN